MDDIIEHIMYPDVKIRGEHGDFATEKTKKLDLPVKGIMKEEPLIMSPDATIKDVHVLMHKFKLTGMLIGNENNLHGIVTHKELLAPFVTSVKPEKFDILFHKNTKKVSGFDKEKAANMLKTEFLQHYEKFLELGFLHVSLEQHKEIKEKLYKITCEMKLSTQKGVFYASNYGWGPMQAMKNTVRSLEHQVQKAKEK